MKNNTIKAKEIGSKMDIFIQLEKSNETCIRYAAFGSLNDKEQFSGIVYGYEGGGEYSEVFIVNDKYIPEISDDGEECLDYEIQEEDFIKLTSQKFLEDCTEAQSEYLKYNQDMCCYFLIEDKMDFFFDGIVASNFPDETNPPSYANTFWDNDKTGSWTELEIKNITSKKI